MVCESLECPKAESNHGTNVLRSLGKGQLRSAE